MTCSKKTDMGIIVSCVIGAAEWWFLSSAPSSTALIIALVLLALLVLGYCLAAVLLPGQETSQPRRQSFVPVEASETYGPNALLS